MPSESKRYATSSIHLLNNLVMRESTSGDQQKGYSKCVHRVQSWERPERVSWVGGDRRILRGRLDA